MQATWPSLEEVEWGLQNGRGQGVRIAVIDSGIEFPHPMLQGASIVANWRFEETDDGVIRTSGNGQDFFGHGTAVASLIHQLAPEAELVSYQALGPQLNCRSRLISAAARVALDDNCHVLNCSFGTSRLEQVLLYKEWVDKAYRLGRHVVAAANNLDPGRVEFPASFVNVIGVAMKAGLAPGDFSTRPGEMVEFGASGDNVEVAWLNGERKLVTGASFAAARMTGLLARMISSIPCIDPLLAKASLKFLRAHRQS